MKTNVGSFDATGRFLVGWVLLFLSMHGLGWWSLLGLIPITTGVLEFCPLYCLFHINTANWEHSFEARHPHDKHLPKH